MIRRLLSTPIKPSRFDYKGTIVVICFIIIVFGSFFGGNNQFSIAGVSRRMFYAGDGGNPPSIHKKTFLLPFHPPIIKLGHPNAILPP